MARAVLAAAKQGSVRSCVRPNIRLPDTPAHTHLVRVAGPHGYDHAPPRCQLVQQQLVQLVSSGADVDGVERRLVRQHLCCVRVCVCVCVCVYVCVYVCVCVQGSGQCDPMPPTYVLHPVQRLNTFPLCLTAAAGTEFARAMHACNTGVGHNNTNSSMRAAPHKHMPAASPPSTLP
jgi:hypothetical protein